MKRYTVYVCETCGYESRSFDDMEEHEANHLGLTVKELHDYAALKSFAKYMGSKILCVNNEEIDARYNKAIEDLLAFERKHHIKKSNFMR